MKAFLLLWIPRCLYGGVHGDGPVIFASAWFSQLPTLQGWLGLVQTVLYLWSLFSSVSGSNNCIYSCVTDSLWCCLIITQGSSVLQLNMSVPKVRLTGFCQWSQVSLNACSGKNCRGYCRQRGRRHELCAMATRFSWEDPSMLRAAAGADMKRAHQHTLSAVWSERFSLADPMCSSCSTPAPSSTEHKSHYNQLPGEKQGLNEWE